MNRDEQLYQVISNPRLTPEIKARTVTAFVADTLKEILTDAHQLQDRPRSTQASAEGVTIGSRATGHDEPPAPPAPKKKVLTVDRWGKLVQIDPDSIPPALPPRMPAPAISHDNKGKRVSDEEALALSIRKGERGPSYRVVAGRVTDLRSGKEVNVGDEGRSGGFGVLVSGMTSRKIAGGW
jgi:hypothetical protein